jgi:hypothetical protein
MENPIAALRNVELRLRAIKEPADLGRQSRVMLLHIEYSFNSGIAYQTVSLLSPRLLATSNIFA